MNKNDSKKDVKSSTLLIRLNDEGKVVSEVIIDPSDGDSTEINKLLSEISSNNLMEVVNESVKILVSHEITNNSVFISSDIVMYIQNTMISKEKVVEKLEEVKNKNLEMITSDDSLIDDHYKEIMKSSINIIDKLMAIFKNK